MPHSIDQKPFENINTPETNLSESMIDLRTYFHTVLAERQGLPNPNPELLRRLLLSQKDDRLVAKVLRDVTPKPHNWFLGKLYNLLDKIR